jgi:hypothetical protein
VLAVTQEQLQAALADFVRKNNRVPGELSCGTFRFTGRATPAAWDVSRTTETLASPYTWNLSGFLPDGTRAVLVVAELMAYTTAAITSFGGDIWDYDFGANNVYESLIRGIRINTTYKPATGAADYVVADICKIVKIGPSKKLYVGLGTTGGGRTINAIYAGYDL